MELALLLLIPLALGLFYYWYTKSKACNYERPDVRTKEQIVALFPSQPSDIKKQVENLIEEAKNCLSSLYDLPEEKRRFNTIFYPLDILRERFAMLSQALLVVSMTSTKAEARQAAQEGSVALNAFAIDNFVTNERLYKLCEQYDNRLKDRAFATQERLTDEQNHLVKETIDDFQRYGVQLPADKRERIAEINKELAVFDTSFEQAVATANLSLELSKEELAGITDTTINNLKRTNNDRYIVPVDGPHVDEILHNCSVASTRKQMSQAFSKRGYPENEASLTKIIRLRDELAQLLGYKSYAHFDIAKGMAQNPETVKNFLNSLKERARVKCSAELEELKKDLPQGVVLTESGQFQPWDLAYARNQYKKKHYALDEAELSHYFPIDTTLPALLKVYEDFFGLHFKKVHAKGLWHNAVEMLMVTKNNEYLGTIILDLYPRADKYTHAGVAATVPSLKLSSGALRPAVAVMVANFPAPTDGRPALLKHRDVVVFFHEFGHALHCLLGSTTYTRFAALEVKRDFVEMPSQMLESWMFDTEILKRVSSHYKTKQPLPDELIKKIQDLKTFGMGDHVLRQLVYAFVSLNYFLPGAHKDVAAIWKELHSSIRDYVQFDPENRGYANFCHLINYGAGYYGYLWSQVYALDLFSVIEKQGVLNRAIGERYTKEILGKGGSEDPADMLRSFLGREPNSDAFFKDLGL